MKSKIRERLFSQLNVVRKKALILCLLAPLLALNFSCKKDEPIEFDLNYSTSMPVPATSYTANVPVEFLTPEIPTESASKFKSAKTTQELISEIKMTKFNISAEGGNLDGLKNISIYLKSSGLGDVLIAKKDSIPPGTTSTAADLMDVNIKEYVFNDKIQFKVGMTLTAGSADTRTFKMAQTLHVKAKLIK